jgi:4-amino-4-deoxy-L-arabinose transferase-like glycosyltransferase
MNVKNKIHQNQNIHQQNNRLHLLSSTRRLIEILIVLAILANCVGIFFPALSSGFTPYYGSIAKNIVNSHNWSDLMLIGQDWLDKPHFPFWITAVSYKLFGVTSHAYIIPGFIFHLIGALYTYKLAKYWYNKDIGLIAVLMYTTSLHLMMSAIDVRAEAYLLGQIIPACYYWLLYDNYYDKHGKSKLININTKIKYLLLGALFTALAMMTKGIFVIITIMSGIIALWLMQGRLRNLASIKWIGALVLSLLLTTPELVALYYQFDIHPEKIVFGQAHVSGIKWFFWDSQFGRFFNTGPIMSTNPQDFHYLYFVHTFLWAFLPWWPIFFLAVWNIIRNTFKKRRLIDSDLYLLASFFITFILFSVTKFQVDHYTNIIFPFACIICARWVVNLYIEKRDKISFAYYAAYTMELLVTLILLIAAIAVCTIILTGIAKIIVYLIIGAIFVMVFILRNKGVLSQLLAYPSLALMVVFVSVMCINGIEYAKYDVGYQIASYMNQRVSEHVDISSTSRIKVVGYDVDLKSLNLNLNNEYSYTTESNLQIMARITQNPQTTPQPFYLVTKLSNKLEVQKYFLNAVIVRQFAGGSIEMFMSNVVLTAKNKISNQQSNLNLDYYTVFKIN